MKKKIRDLAQNKSFCTLAWTGTSISPTGYLAPCCLFEESIKDQSGNSFKIYQDEIGVALNSTYMKNVRAKMISGELIDACSQCYSAESHGGISLRTQSNADPILIKEDYSIDEYVEPYYIDFKLNNKCNLKCRMCQPKDSNLVYNEFSEISKAEPSFANFENTKLYDPELRIDLNDFPNWEDSDDFFKKIEHQLPHLKSISLVGGEPLIVESVYRILDLAIETGHAEHIKVFVTSNFMAVNEAKLVKFVEHFKMFTIFISLDAVSSELHYIRFPSKFDRILSNYKKFFEISKTNPRFLLRFAVTIQMYNLLYLDGILNFLDQLHKEDELHFDGLLPPLSFTYVKFPKHLSMDIAPDNIRKVALAKIKMQIIDSVCYKAFPKHATQINQLMGAIKDSISPDRERLIQEFLYYTEVLDKKRGQRLQDHLPELHKLLVENNFSARPPLENIHIIREKGWFFSDKKNLKDAINCFEKALTIENEDHFIDYRELGWMYFARRKFDQSYENYKKAFAINQEDIHTARGLIYASLKVKDKNLARQALDTAIRIEPENKELRNIKI